MFRILPSLIDLLNISLRKGATFPETSLNTQASMSSGPGALFGLICPCRLMILSSLEDLRRKASRLVAAKCTLASRVDSARESADGSIGKMLREDIEKKLDKLQEPPPVKFVKPLPKPIDPSRKKRGGKRVRKLKERYAMTELRKQANRLNFGEIEDDAYQEDLGYTRGAIGSKTGGGRVRLPQVDEKTKVRISKALQRNLQRAQHNGATPGPLSGVRTATGSTTASIRRQVSGTASSVAFTPLQVQ
ncbi:hypothetical protein J437_LFUL018697 [Ladona fulva]|uniref:U4/U6 small nuclear ribonucleoprotein Prp31 n=1 Tax=Ladona fulva TaxID=123851 RepID=A0A8K0KQG9_LADFU|nr:hypothetical protein J437_LFUL018697 [Ladona fulva]